MHEIKAIIVDDEEKNLRLTSNLLKQFNEIVIMGLAKSVDTALELVKMHDPSVIFLDVEMPEKNGFELIRMLQQTNFKPEIVFVTAYDKYAIEAFKHSAFNYLLKPIDKDELNQVIMRLSEKKVAENINEKFQYLINCIESKNRLKLNTRTGYLLIEPNNIIFCEADGSYTEIHQINNQQTISTFNIGQIEPLLPSSEFYRISRSVIINLSFLQEVNRKKKTCTILFGVNKKTFNIPKKQIKDLENTI